ncbi:MAG: nucleoside deaminase [Desulfovibrionaceae bacterium]
MSWVQFPPSLPSYLMYRYSFSPILLMSRALHLAQKAYYLNEVPVGALVCTHDGHILGEGYNSPIALNDPTAHAEIRAIRNATKKRSTYRMIDAILIVTIEPCLMCYGAIVHSRIQGIIFASTEPKSGIISRNAIPPFLNHKPWIEYGFLKEEASALMKNFFLSKRSIKKSTP